MSAFPRPRALRSSFRVALALTSLTIFLAGCLTLKGTLDAKGGGTIDLSYPMPLGSSLKKERALFESPDVTIASFTETDGGQKVAASLTFPDVTKISSARWFRNTTITRTPDGDNETLRVVVKNPNAKKVDTKEPGPTFTFTLPGKIVKSNAPKPAEGNTVTWTYPLAEFAAAASTEMSVTYEAPKADAAKPAAAKPADAKPAAK